MATAFDIKQFAPISRTMKDTTMADAETLNKIIEIYKERIQENPGTEEQVLREAHQGAWLLEQTGFLSLALESYERILMVNPKDRVAKVASERIVSLIQ